MLKRSKPIRIAPQACLLALVACSGAPGDEAGSSSTTAADGSTGSGMEEGTSSTDSAASGEGDSAGDGDGETPDCTVDADCPNANQLCVEGVCEDATEFEVEVTRWQHPLNCDEYSGYSYRAEVTPEGGGTTEYTSPESDTCIATWSGAVFDYTVGDVLELVFRVHFASGNGIGEIPTCWADQDTGECLPVPVSVLVAGTSDVTFMEDGQVHEYTIVFRPVG